MSDPRWEVFRGKDNQYYFNLTGTNNRILLQSEGYRNQTDAIDTIHAIIKLLLDIQKSPLIHIKSAADNS